MNRPIAFGEFVLDLEQRQLTRLGAPLHLTRKAFDLLALLAARRPAVVSRRDIQAALWADTFVSDTNLGAIVFEVRAALGESARRPQFLRTVHGVGYALGTDAPAPNAVQAGCRLVVAGDVIELVSGEHLVGRSRDCTIRFQSARVSRIHARLTVAGRAATLEDVGSRNGTFVGGVRVNGPVVLSDGVEIIFGTEVARFDQLDAGSQTEATDA
ncbi:MAG TPA: FHA domain-containing protein [Vicinamibacterales bacterium]|jgi:DNA-binding winged helix-turn-helix (wHTH) protein